jgi:hypothetical protein
MLAVPDILNCAADWVQFDGQALNGRMDVRFLIEANGEDGGSVTRVSTLDGGVGNAFLQGCILSALREAPFQTPKDGAVELDLPLQFFGPAQGRLPDGGPLDVYVPSNSPGVIIFEAPDAG